MSKIKISVIKISGAVCRCYVICDDRITHGQIAVTQADAAHGHKGLIFPYMRISYGEAAPSAKDAAAPGVGVVVSPSGGVMGDVAIVEGYFPIEMQSAAAAACFIHTDQAMG